MTSRERVSAVLNHEKPDRVPCDFGGSPVTGMHVSVVYALRQALGLDPPGTPVQVTDPFQMLGQLKPDLLDALEIDTVELAGTGTFFGYKREGWKPWTTFDGTPVLVPGDFNTEPNADGSISMHPQGDRTAKPSGLMPKGGYYFDNVQRGEPVDWDHLEIEDNLEEFTILSREELEHLSRESHRLRQGSERAIFACLPGGGLGDIAWVPGPFLRSPKGIRNYDDWLTSLLIRPDFIYRLFERQCEIALQNLALMREAVEDRLDVLFVTGADYGSQHAPSISPEMYRALFMPHYRKMNDWIHAHTPWKTFMHSCGAVEPLILGFIEAGFDILNPVQCSAACMDARDLKRKYGDSLVFWGGGVDTQKTLPFGTPEDVRRQVTERIAILGEGGGYVFNAIHNIQPGTPVDNVLAMFEAWREWRPYA